MKAVKLNKELVPAFVEYFKLYSKEQDESFPPGDDYKPDIDEPAYVLIDDAENIAGAAALMLGKAYREAGTGRFRIFHCVRNEISHYRLLLNEVLKHTDWVDYIYCFIEDSKTETRKIWESLGFKIRRYSWVLKRKTEDFSPPVFPQGFQLRTFKEGTDEGAWCEIINESFAGMDGHVHFYPEKIAQWKKDPSYIAGGMKMLWHDKKPVGTMLLISENENGEQIIFIEAVGILNSYQGRGLGKNMLRAGIEFGKNFGVNNVMLSVNAENEKAVELYLNEGFEKEATIICYSFDAVETY